ncbi:hypothetical protein H0H92_001999 [Tricholoma furcatifolium]|nr:hypothetical protein H0H92_001999 [Tricholoma furcatifolium]
MEVPKVVKKRKITDKAIPNVILQNPDFAEDSRMYQDLLDMERKLDWTMMRKRSEIQDALTRNPTTTRTLRIFLSHTVSGQLWQGGGDITANFETGEGIPAWVFKIDGRLLELPTQRARDKTPQRKFSTMIKRMVIELDRDPALYPEGNIVEWPRASGHQNPAVDGFTIRRTGDSPTKLRVVLYLDHFPEQYKVLGELGAVLGIKTESRIGVIQAIWNYIKVQGLQDKADRRVIRADDRLRPIFGGEQIFFYQIPELVNQYLAAPDPVLLHYTLNPTVPPPERFQAWDVEVKMEDFSLKSRMAAMVIQSKESSQGLAKMDEEISLLAQSLHNSHLKKTFLESFAKDPAKFIQTWLESQSRDLESVLGSGPSEGMTVRQEELKRSEFFRLPWVEEAVAIQEGMRLASKGMHVPQRSPPAMASKQLGKLRQWAGEVISSREKTTLSEEFQELEKDIELRRDGAIKLLAASAAYQHTMAKKKKIDTFEDTEKLLPIDRLGVVMVMHGEDFGDDSAFGSSLVKLGRAHCKVAALQEGYALNLNDTFVASLEAYTGEIKEYEVQRKKLESRRLSYDAAVAKCEKLKSSKKEKERREAEEEMEKARDRYDETSEDVQARMHAIQDKEITQMRDLTSFVNLEINFVEQYLNVLKEVRADWYEESSLMHVPPRRTSAPPHVFSHPSKEASDSDDEASRKPSKRSGSFSSKGPSRSTSRASRRRADSEATIGEKSDKELEKEKEKEKISKRMSVAGWASSAVDSVTGRGKKNKDKEKFASLTDDAQHDEDVDEDGMRSSPSKKSSTFHSLTRRLSKSKESSPQLPPKILKPPSLQEKKIVRATHSFSGGTDELTFVAGEEIVVLNEVLDDWWLGELHGNRGLFPTTYVELAPPRPTLPQRPGGSRRAAALSTVFSPVEAVFSNSLDDDKVSYASTDMDDYHDFGKQPLSAHHGSPFLSGPHDGASVISSLTDDEDDKLLVPLSRTANFGSGFDDNFQATVIKKSSGDFPSALASILTTPPALPRRATSDALPSGATTPNKKAPPPPPPRRATSTSLGPTPPVPERPYKPNGRSKTTTPASSIRSYDRSPFESATELTTPDPPGNGCGDFKQHPFQEKGMWKSSLVKQFIDNHFVDAYYPTIETTSAKTITYKGVEYDCHIIDTAGQDEYSPVNSQHAIGIHGYVLVYSIASRASFDMIQIVYDKIIDFCGVTDVPCVIVGAKNDLNPRSEHPDRQVQFNEGQKLAQKLNTAFVETSAKENSNIVVGLLGKVFDLCLEQIEKRSSPNEAEPPASRCVIM